MKRLSFVAVLCLLICTSCNPVKQLQRRQQLAKQIADEYIKDHPISTGTATKFKPGYDSLLHFEKKAWEAINEKERDIQSLQQKYRDTCRSAIEKFSEGYNLGYKTGVWMGKQTPIHDTIEPTAAIQRFQEQNNQLRAERDTARIQEANSKKWFWIFLLTATISLLLLIALLIKIF